MIVPGIGAVQQLGALARRRPVPSYGPDARIYGPDARAGTSSIVVIRLNSS
jgi:hypothetical protein